MAFAMLATAIRRKPSATWRGVRGCPVAAAISSARAANFSPHHVGIERRIAIRAEDRREMLRLDLADQTLASVTVSGPPRR